MTKSPMTDDDEAEKFRRRKYNIFFLNSYRINIKITEKINKSKNIPAPHCPYYRLEDIGVVVMEKLLPLLLSFSAQFVNMSRKTLKRPVVNSVRNRIRVLN